MIHHPTHETQLRKVCITGCGSYAPERVLTNAELEKFVDTTDEWIVTRTGMKERHIAAENQATSDLGAEAARRCLEDAGVQPEQVELLITPTISPDVPWPNTACIIQDKIGARNATCIGLEAACSGLLFATETARNYVACGAVDVALVVGAEKMSAFLDWQDRGTCVLFGDGAGAVLLQSRDQGRGIICAVTGSDGSLYELLLVPGGGSRMPASAETVRDRQHYLKMNGREVYKHAVTKMSEAAKACIEHSGLSVDDVQWVIPHQANIRIIQAVAQRLHVSLDRFIINIEKYGNTSGASIGLAMDEAVRDGRIQHGDIILWLAFGGGFTWGAMLFEF